MAKIVEINKCNECPYFHEGIPGNEHRESCRKENFKSVPFDVQKYIFPIPEWCPLENKK